MSIEKRNFKMKHVLIVVLLAAIVILVFGGLYMLLQQDAPLRGDEMSRNFSPMRFESAQTGPTGRMVMSTGIVLLLIGLGVLVALFWAGRKRTHYKPS